MKAPRLTARLGAKASENEKMKKYSAHKEKAPWC